MDDQQQEVIIVVEDMSGGGFVPWKFDDISQPIVNSTSFQYNYVTFTISSLYISLYVNTSDGVLIYS